MNGESYADYGIEAPASGNGEYRTICPNCEKTHHQRGQKDLAVNLEKGVWHCHRCGFDGGLKQGMPVMGIVTARNTQSPPKLTETVKESVSLAKNSFPKLQPLTAAALAYLAGRGISEDTAKLAGLKSAEEYSHRAGKRVACIAFPVMRGGQCLNIKYRPLEIKDFLQTKGGDQTAMFNGDSMTGAETIIFTEGEIDTLSVLECGYPCAVSCPNGAPPAGAKNLDKKLSFIEENRAAFEAAERVILCMDKDEPGLAFEQRIAAAIGAEKCFTVDYPIGCKDANDCLTQHGKPALIAALDHAKAFPIPGITDFQHHSEEILEHWESHGEKNLFSTGLAGVDRFCRLQLGTLNILTGIPGHGKSEFLDQIIINTVRLYQWRWCIYSPENYPIANHFQKLAGKWTEKPFSRPGKNSTWGIDAMSRTEVVSTIDILSRQITVLTAGEDGGDDLSGILRRVEVSIRRYGCRAFLIDPWNEVDHHRPPHLTETEYISQSLTICRNFARRFHVMCWIIAHPTKLQKDKQTGEYPVPTPWDIAGSANWRNKADVCWCVWRDVTNDNGIAELHIQKVRNSNAGYAGGLVRLNRCRANGVYSCQGERSESDQPPER